LLSFKDQVIFEKSETVKQDGTPYTVFTPYSRAWKKQLTARDIEPLPSENLAGGFMKRKPSPVHTAEKLGFTSAGPASAVPVIREEIIRNYHNTRDIPSLEGTTRLGVHLRFGTVSIRNLVRMVLFLSDTWLNELIWREFFMTILWHFPYVKDNSFKAKYDAIAWRNNEDEFDRWCKGMTGYPIVDAGMRELNTTGFMHNRVRMITASFLVKHLLTDWRWGEAYFAAKLLDNELFQQRQLAVGSRHRLRCRPIFQDIQPCGTDPEV
jgi:deoxyribodipyrimidine photo-lyase